jgi:hypothetical protein
MSVAVKCATQSHSSALCLNFLQKKYTEVVS